MRWLHGHLRAPLSIFCVSLASTAAAQQVADWENPAVFAINKQPPHATLFPYESRDLALARDEASSAYYLLLNGRWKFNWVRAPAQ